MYIAVSLFCCCDCCFFCYQYYCSSCYSRLYQHSLYSIFTYCI